MWRSWTFSFSWTHSCEQHVGEPIGNDCGPDVARNANQAVRPEPQPQILRLKSYRFQYPLDFSYHVSRGTYLRCSWNVFFKMLIKEQTDLTFLRSSKCLTVADVSFSTNTILLGVERFCAVLLDVRFTWGGRQRLRAGTEKRKLFSKRTKSPWSDGQELRDGWGNLLSLVSHLRRSPLVLLVWRARFWLASKPRAEVI